jgi:ribonuclease R
MYVEGLVHITELGGEYFKFDEIRCELRGERTGLRYAIGTRVNVQVSRVDLDGRKIDFRLVRDGEAVRLPSGGIARLDADDSATGRPARKRDKGSDKTSDRHRGGASGEHGSERGRSGATSTASSSIFDVGLDTNRGPRAPASRKSASKTGARAPSQAVARAPASPIQALRAAVKKAAAKGKGKRRGR